MSRAFAIQHSPVISPSSSSSSPLFSKSSSTLTLTKSPSSSPSSPARLIRLQKPPQQLTGLASTSPTLSKRKRPARLDIPMVSMSFGNVPKTPCGLERVENEGDGYAVCCKRGRRDIMEDRYSAFLNYHGHSKQAIFGVFDGHGGTKVAEFAAGNLGKNIMEQVERRSDDEIELGVKEGYLKTDSEFLEEDTRGGSCCVTTLIREGKLVVSNAGDCRAVVSRDGVAEALTADHRPSREDEKHMIESSGGYVDCRNGVSRILGPLAVSRGIGDQYLKQWVIAVPGTRILRLKPELEFLILASDGLWDKVANQEAVDIVRDLCKGVDKPQTLTACKKLVDLAVTRGSSDDISVMLIQLTQFY